MASTTSILAFLRSLVASLAPLMSYRTAFLLLALINLKSLPLSWHIRIFNALIRNWQTPASVRRRLLAHAHLRRTRDETHPIFRPVSIYSRTPLLEIDYNLHKSNSTYFTDLDVSRTALVTSLISPDTMRRNRALEAQGYRGPVSVILGAVHTSFHKEIRAYERYEVRSRVLGWDRKWLVIGSWFVRPGRGGKEGEGEVLLASCLNKYVIKKGRFTVAPERTLRSAGWLPEKPDGGQEATKHEKANIGTSDHTTVPAETPSTDQPPQQRTPADGDGIAAPIPEPVVSQAEGVVEKLEQAASKTEGTTTGKTIDLIRDAAIPPRAAEWDWHRIEMERLRGMQMVEGWMAIDMTLVGEFAHGS